MAALNQIPLPLDFRPMGITLRLDYANRADLDNPALFGQLAAIPPADNQLSWAIDATGRTVFRAHGLALNSYIKVTGLMFRVISHIGNGAFGTTCRVARDDPANPAQEVHYVLKEINVSADPVKNLNVVKEAIINKIVHGALIPSCAPDVHVIFTGIRGGQARIYIISELLSITSGQYIAGMGAARRLGAVSTLYGGLVNRLRVLYEAFRFNHGDFHAENSMFGFDDRPYIIDFGYAQITLPAANGNVIVINTNSGANTVPNRSKDLSLMTASLLRGYPALAAAHRTAAFIKSGYGCDWIDTYSNDTPRMCGNMPIANGWDVYKLLDVLENPRGKFSDVTANILLSTPYEPRPIAAGIPPAPPPRRPRGAGPRFGGYRKRARRNKTIRRSKIRPKK